MSDVVERLKSNQCPENSGCGTQPRCACADMDDAADEIETLRAQVVALQAREAVMREALEHQHERMMVDALMSGPRWKGYNRGNIAGRTVDQDYLELSAALSAPPSAGERVIEAARGVMYRLGERPEIITGDFSDAVQKLHEALAALSPGATK